WTLIHLKYERHVFAGNGESGSRQRSSGASGEDKIIEVPLGTVARDADTGEFLFEITRHGEEKILAKGGRGGLGNFHFKTATNQAPRYAQPGEPGIEMAVILELKLLGDVGLVGRSEEHTSELQSRENLVCRLLLVNNAITYSSTTNTYAMKA